MILCDYLSRIAVDDDNPDEVIPISFNALAQYRLVDGLYCRIFSNIPL